MRRRLIIHCCLLCGCLALCVFALGGDATRGSRTPTPVESARHGYTRGHAGHYTAWVQFTLSPHSLHGRLAARPSHFTADDRQPLEFRWRAADYAGGRWDIGHLCEAPAQRSVSGERATFLFTNTMPQSPALNRGQWAQLEKYIRQRVLDGETATVVAGPAFLPAKGAKTIQIETIGEHHLWVPTHCWRAVLFERDRQREATAWLIPNHDIDDFRKYRVSIDELEASVGFDLFPGLTESLER